MRNIIVHLLGFFFIKITQPLIIFNQMKSINLLYNIMPFFLKREFQKKYCKQEIKNGFNWKIKLLNGRFINLPIKSNKDWFNALAFYNYAPELCHIEDLIAKHLNINSHYIDIGANCGHRSFRLLSDQRFVHLIDANPQLCENLFELMKVNSFKNFKISNYGISNESSELTFYIHKRNSMSSFIKPNDYSDVAEELKINCITLDDYFQINKIEEKFNFVKIDVEGLEAKVILGGTKTIKNYNNIYLVEISLESDKIKILNTFREMGYITFGLNWGISDIVVEINLKNEDLHKYLDFVFLKNSQENQSLISSLKKL